MKKVWQFLKKLTPVIKIGNPSGNPNGHGFFIGIKWTF